MVDVADQPATALDHLVATIAASLPAIGGGVVVIGAFWITAVALRSLAARLSRRFRFQEAGLEHLLTGLTFWLVMIFGLITGFGTMGINVSAIVASLGLTGFALGFALHDMISNLLAGVLILFYRPFHTGDHIKVTDFEGEVVAIDLRYTTVRAEGRRHLIPNQTLYTNPVTVMERAPEAAPAPR